MRMHIHPKKNAQETLDRLRNQNNAEIQGKILKLCKDCQYHTCRFNDVKGKIFHGCKRPELLDVVTGEPTNPYSNRNNALLCGRDGKYWLSNPPKVVPSE